MLSGNSGDDTSACMYTNNRYRQYRNNNNNNKLGYEGGTRNIATGGDNLLSASKTDAYASDNFLHQPQPFSSLAAAADPGLDCQRGGGEYNSTPAFSHLYSLGNCEVGGAGLNPHGTTRDQGRASPPSCVYQSREARPQQRLPENVYTTLQPLSRFSPGQDSTRPLGAYPGFQPPGTSSFHPHHGQLPSSTAGPMSSTAAVSTPFYQTNTHSSGQALDFKPWPYLSDSGQQPCRYLAPNPIAAASSSTFPVSTYSGGSHFQPLHDQSSARNYNPSIPLTASPSQPPTYSSAAPPNLLTLPYLLDSRYLPVENQSSALPNRATSYTPRNSPCPPDFSAMLTACDREPVPSNSRRLISRSTPSTWVARGKDNCAVMLYNGDMWAKFHTHTNEMIITKHGRRMFPVLHFKISGLAPDKHYHVSINMVLADDSHWKFQAGKWVSCGNADTLPAGGQTYQHPDSPNTGAFWCKQEISFGKLKLTNNKITKQKQIIVNSMHRYQPRIHIKECLDGREGEELLCHAFEDTQFIAVTAYQNTDITDLKVNFNPYARGMRDKNRSSNDAMFANHGLNQRNFQEEPTLNQYVC